MSNVSYDFKGRVAVVTGGAGGFGIAIARRLIAAGAHVSLWDMNADALAAVAGSLGEQASYQALDITDENAVAAAAENVQQRYGHIDTLVNNAGILGPVAPLWEHSAAQFRAVLDVNLTGAFLCMKILIPKMLLNPEGAWRGRIVNVASIQGKEGMPQASAYAASKAGLIGLTKVVGKELALTGILANVITPAAVMTAMSHQIDETRKQEILNKIPMQRFLTSDEVARQVIWLCSSDCSFATGSVFDLSGGRATY
jgi:NAD(P)-dependent dehydrogenase (short-subunit alcohol dehydrogenase family)